MEAVQCTIDEAHETILLKKKEAQSNVERHAKAKSAIDFCNAKVFFQARLILSHKCVFGALNLFIFF